MAGTLRRFLLRNRLGTEEIAGLETDRDRYFTPANCQIHFDMFAERAVALGYASINPEYDPSVDPTPMMNKGKPIPQKCCKILLNELGERCILSFDETAASLDRTVKGRNERTVVVLSKYSKSLIGLIVDRPRKRRAWPSATGEG